MSDDVVWTHFKTILLIGTVFTVSLLYHQSFMYLLIVEPLANHTNSSPNTIIASSYLDCRYEDNVAKVRVIGIRKCEHKDVKIYGKLRLNTQEIDLELKPKLLRSCPWFFAKGNFVNLVLL